MVLPPESTLLSGMVTIVIAEPPDPSAYRAPHAETLVVAPCPIEALERAIDLALAARAMWAVAVLTIAASPLVALAALGFLWP